MFLNKDPVDLPALQDKVIALRMDDPDLSIVIRGSARTTYQRIVSVMDMLQQANVAKVDLATEAEAVGYPGSAIDTWTERARTWASGGTPDGLETVNASPAKPEVRDVFLYVISGFKVRNPLAAMALIERAG